jgi:hypothetical protein
VNDESIKYYELLGVGPGASAQELKAAHRDLAKVWHPDRFAHDLRLQKKAQEKLKEINEAYDQLIYGKTGRRKQASKPAYQTEATAHRSAPVKDRKSMGLHVYAFVLLFCAAPFALYLSGKQTPSGTAPQAGQTRVAEKEDGPQPGITATPFIDSSRSKRVEQQPLSQSSREAKTDGATVSEPEAKNARPLPTVTLMIDPATGMLATPDCPNRSRMTYPSGTEPREYCNAHRKAVVPAQADPPRPKESRLKSFAKRIVAPAGLLKGRRDAETESGKKEAKSPGGGNR